MITAARFGVLAFTILLALFWSIKSNAAPSHYKLGIVLVIDQFRADYLSRFDQKFQGTGANGFKTLMNKGAYFPLADHGLFQDMTGPGHAAILSGSYPYRNHISLNYWFNRELGKGEYCVQDDSKKTIGSDGVVATAISGISPKNFNATTIGDELKNVDRPSRVVSIALKDRAAVLMGGKRADEVFWFDYKTCQWVTSDYYRTSLPEYVLKRNSHIRKLQKDSSYSWGPYKNVRYCSTESTQSPWAVQETIELALSAMDQMKLGQGKDTDLLFVSLSSHDYLGHKLGPNDPAMEKMTLEEDKLIGNFLTAIDKKVPGGLSNVFVVLTGDHGVPPHPKHLPVEKLPAANIPEETPIQLVEDLLTKEFGKPEGGKWLLGVADLQFFFQQKALEKAKLTVNQVVQFLRPKLLKEIYLDGVYSRDEIMLDRKIPSGEYGKVLDRTLSRNSGDMILLLKPFFYSDSYPVTHMTMYSYDRYVPLIFWGKTFKPGVYRQIVNIVDIAPTLSSTLGVIPPSQSEGRVLNEILR